MAKIIRRKPNTSAGEAKVSDNNRKPNQGRPAKSSHELSGNNARSGIDYSIRYGKNYKKQCAIAHNATKGMCCCCLVRKSEEVHHSHYWKSGKSRPGQNLFPVCGDCHKKSHSPKYWIVSKKNPVFGNRNTDEWRERLILGFKMLSS